VCKIIILSSLCCAVVPSSQSGHVDSQIDESIDNNHIVSDDSGSERSDSSLTRVHIQDAIRTESSRKHVSFSNPLTLKMSPSRDKKSTVEKDTIMATNNSHDDWGDWNVDVDNVVSESSHSPTYSEPSGLTLSKQPIATKALTSRGLGKFNPNQPLGSEYDIMQITLKVSSPSTTSEDLDFFADMAPEIKPTKSGNLLDVIDIQSRSSTSRFNVTTDDSVVFIMFLLVMHLVLYWMLL